MIVIIFFAALEIRFSIDDLFKVVLIEYFKTFTETVIYTAVSIVSKCISNTQNLHTTCNGNHYILYQKNAMQLNF